MKALSLVFLVLSCLFTVPPTQMEDDWKLVSSEGDLKVYKRDKDGSSYKEIKIETILVGDANRVVAILRDAEGYKNWIYKCASSKRIKTISPSEFIYYTRADLPSPIWDRDIVAHSTYHYDKANTTHYFNSRAENGHLDKIDDAIRVSDFHTSWNVKDLGNGKVAIVNQMHMEPSGSLPAWLVNMGVTKGPQKTIKGLQDLLSKK